jgi:asparagine synthase (glutamine-hydrolysing)
VPSGTEPGEEQRHIELLESSRQVQVARVAMGKVGDRNDLEAVAWRAESPRFDDGWCAERPMIDAASAQGARTLLTGLWSDQIFFVTGYLTDLARRMAWRQVATHLREYPRWFVDVRFQYFVARFCRDLFFNLTPDGVRASLRPLVRSRARQPAAALVGPALAAHARRRRARIPRPRCASAHARDIYQFVRAKAHRLQFEADDKLAASCGIDSVTPFLDRDLLAFLMSIPGEIQNRDGVPRAILRDSMRGLVPDRILGRRWRDEYAALERTRQAVYLSPPAELCAARSLGFVRQTTAIGDESLEFLGLEFWSRVFFSDRLTVPQPQFDDAIRP